MADALRERILQAAAADEASVDAVAAAIRQAAGAHDLDLDDALLADAVGHALTEGVSLSELHAGDLYLAAACARGQAAALRRFDALFGPELDRAIARSPSLGLGAAEFRQLVADRLFVGGDAAPKITKYSGKGPLKAWVRVMTSRFVIDLARRADPPSVSADVVDSLGTGDPEMDYLRHAYGPLLDEAFASAIASLSVRQRNLLRQRYLHRAPTDSLAKMYGVHRSTLFVWLEDSRAALLKRVREALAVKVPGDQLESVVGMLGSKLQVSVRRLLDSRLESE